MHVGDPIKPIVNGDASPQAPEIPPVKQVKPRPIPVPPPRSPRVGNKVVKTPSPTLWKKIERFFVRHFTSIDQKDKVEALAIKAMASDVEETLTAAAKAAKVASNAQLSHSYPTDASLEIERTFNDAVTSGLLDQAIDQLDTLTQQTDIAKKLAEKHATYDSLTSSIQELTKRVNLLESRVLVGKALGEVEVALKNYKENQTWDNFHEVNLAKDKLGIALKGVIAKYPALKDDSTLKKYADKPDLSFKNAYRIINYLYPDMKGHLDRLYDVNLKFSEIRIQDLHGKVETLLPLYSKYKHLSDKIDGLEKSLFDNSILSRIYRVFHRPYTLRIQLEQAKHELKRTFDAIEKAGHFETGEIAWFRKKSESNDDLESLAHRMERINVSLNFIKLKDPISSRLSDLMQNLSEYHEAEILLENAKKKGKEGIFELKHANALVDTHDARICANFFSFGQQLHALTASKGLPHNKLENLAQVRELLRSTCPAIDVKAKVLIDYIEKHPMKDTVILRIKDGEKSPAVKAKPAVAIPPPAADEDLSIHELLEEPQAAEKEKAAEKEIVENKVESQDSLVEPGPNNQPLPPPPPPPPPSRSAPPAPRKVIVAAGPVEKEPMASLLSAKVLRTSAAAPVAKDPRDEMLKLVQKGVTDLKPPVEDDKRQNLQVPPKEKDARSAVLDDIRSGNKKLKPPPARTFRKKDEIFIGVRKGTISVADLTEEEKKQLSVQELGSLELMEKMAARQATLTSDKKDKVDDADWD